MDWATAAIEAVGLLILGIWIIIPINEFKEILAKVRHRPGEAGAHHGDVKQPPPPVGPEENQR